jgi:hypothetical protein
LDASSKDRFMQHVAVRAVGECWEWQASTDGRYGDVFWEGRTQKAHRVSWMLHRGPIPDGLLVLHGCDNPPCVNPNHLFLGTQSVNIRDCTRKGRNGAHRHPDRLATGDRNGTHTHPHRVLRGSSNVSAKLTEERVREIRSDYARGIRRKYLAVMHGVSKSTIDNITKGRLWKHVS